MTASGRPPLITLLASHWVSMLGVALATTAGFSWLFVLPQHLRGDVDNPYIGILIFFAIPALLLVGLALIPLGIFLARRRIEGGFAVIANRPAAWRRLGVFFGVLTFANLVIGSQATYRAVQHMETVQFCGQTCHVMKPEFTARQHAPHSHVDCVDCHVAPGASGWFASKMAGTRQLLGVVTNSYPRPIKSAIESNRLVDSAETCERCHAREREIGSPMKVISSFKPDESNTRSETVLMMLVGGRSWGIHGAHLGPGVKIRYAAADAKRQTIPWVEYRDGRGNTSTFVTADAGNVASLPTFEMQCVDCHNRPAHSFQPAERAIDQSLASGELASLPYMKKKSVELLSAVYSDEDAAAREIPAQLGQFYRSSYPDVSGRSAAQIGEAGERLAALYNQNVFPDLKVTWGTYVSNLGHTDSPGCFRCHDEGHSTKAGKTITQDCGTCHQMVAAEEPSPEVLKTLGIADRMAALQKLNEEKENKK